MSKRNARIFGRVAAWTLTLVMVLSALNLPVFGSAASGFGVAPVPQVPVAEVSEDLTAAIYEAIAEFFEGIEEQYEEVAPLAEPTDFPPHWTQAGTTTYAQGNIARVATATTQHANGANTGANAINGTIPTAAGNNHWNTWGAGATVGSQTSPVWLQLSWNAPYVIEGLRVMWHIFTDAGVQWPRAANAQFLNDQGQWQDIFAFTPTAGVATAADPNTPIGVDGRSGANPANRPWPAPTSWAPNPVWNVVEFPAPVETTALRLLVFGAKTGGTSPGIGVGAFEVFGAQAALDPVTLMSIGNITVVSGADLLPGTVLRAGDLVFDGVAGPFHEAAVNLQWQRSASADGPWTNIGGATGRNYTTISADATNFLRVVATSGNAAILGGPVNTAAFGPMAAVPVCPADGCYRSACLVHCQVPTCAQIARLCECVVCHHCVRAGREECNLIPGQCFKNFKKTAVSWPGGANPNLIPANSIETEHYIIMWENTGRWATHRPDSEYMYLNHNQLWVPLDILAAEVDRIFEHFLFEMGFHYAHDRAPAAGRVGGNQLYDSYRGVFRLWYNAGWTASGGTATHFCPVCNANRGGIQQFQQSVGATRPMFNPLTECYGFPTVVHEMAHSFQGSGGAGPLGHAELHSQHSVMNVYPHVFFWEHHYFGAQDFSHMGFEATNMVWSNPLFYEDWASTHGKDIITRLARSGHGGDVLNRYRLYFDLTHDQMGDRMFDSARRMVTWDMDTLRDYVQPFSNMHSAGFTNDGGDWYRVARGLAPNPWGFNAVRLEVPTVGNTVTIDFRGALQSEFFGGTNNTGGGRQFGANDNQAGWRYGFLAMTEDGTRHYGQIHSANLANREGTATFVVPENTEYLWFVVLAAPVVNWNNAHAGAANGNHTWVYDLRLGANTYFNTRNVGVVYTTRVDTSVLESSIAAAQAVVEPCEDLVDAIAAALALDADATQAQVTAATTAILALILDINQDTQGRLNQATAITWANGNIARNTPAQPYNGTLRLSHLRFHFDSPVGHTSNANALRNGTLSGGTWSTWAGFIDGVGGASMMPFPHNSSPTPRWTEHTGWVNGDPRDRHFMTMEWPSIMQIDGTRVLWHQGDPHIESRERGVAFAGFFGPDEDIYVEYLCPNTNQWIRIEHMINEAGEGVGTMGNRVEPGFAHRLWNGVAFEPVYTRSLRINFARSPFSGLFTATGATQWEIFGESRPDFDLNVFNNGNDNVASIAGTIRMWTRLNGVNAIVPYADLDVTATFPNGQCAMDVVRINRIWNNPGYVNMIDVDKNVNWQRIYFTATLYGQTVELVLLNNRAVPFTLDIFNNGQGGTPSRPNASLAQGGTIRMWTQLGGVNAPVTHGDLQVTAVLPNGQCALQFIHINHMWANPGNVNHIDANARGNWQRIYLTVTLTGQTVEVVLV
ncbi:MAG: DUF6055 domain-containing protein, partial [Defluviitaleaceae bacterium]|nr:DUF6055 domain-containing protein [Defluviitaleaceae bacterium]